MKRLDIRIDVRPVDGVGVIESALDQVASLIKAELVCDGMGCFEMFDQLCFEALAVRGP